MNKQKYIIVIVDSDYPSQFEDEVNDKIDEGYSPQGGVALRYGSSNGANLIQAMILVEKICIEPPLTS